ncbi:hypothetical protein NDA16_004691 [Ustilago loliicola]|nr:hypothetical protein NDA16_004691 [Ustilago loliicola]
MSAAYSNSSRALAFLSETSEDAIVALKGLVGGVGSAKYLDTSEDKLSTIATQIDSSRDEDRIAALTRIVAMISKGRDASSFLPAVLKLTSASNLDVRKLVYIVLLRYANNNPDLTLLSINSFQRDLSDPSPLIRAMALRVLSSIKVAMVAPIVIMAVTKASRDPNLYVRKIAALAIPKCYQIDRSQLDTLQEVLRTLLSDRSPFVLGAALSAFQRMCPTNWELIHQNYRKICHALADMDEWGQIVALQVLSRYARANLSQPKTKEGAPIRLTAPSSKTPSSSAARTPEPEPATSSKKASDVDGLEAFLSSDAATSSKGTSLSKAASPAMSTSPSRSPSDMDRDLELLLTKSQGLLHSRNPAVVLAVARLILYLAPASDHGMLTRPLVRLLRSTPDVTYLVLLNILAISRQKASLFAPHITSFFLGASHEEPVFVSLLKLDVLVTICNKPRAGPRTDAGEENTTAEEGSVDSIQAAIEKAARTVGETASEDDADLKGVRLRREQVIHVLFEGKTLPASADATLTDKGSTETGTGNASDTLSDDGPEIASLSLVLGGKLIKGWLDTKLPPWTDTPTSADIREPPAVTAPSHPSLQNTTLSNLKSFSSNDFAASSPLSSSPVVLTPGKGTSTPPTRNATPIELEASTTSAQAQQKYKDLDSFLDESDEEQEAEEAYLDDSAPEDDDFRGQNDWDDQGEDDIDSDEEDDYDDEEDDDEESSMEDD